MARGAMLDALDRVASARIGVMTMFAARIAAAYRSGMPREHIAATVAALRRELQGALRALAEQAETAPSSGQAAATIQNRRHSRQGRHSERTCDAPGGKRDDPRSKNRAATTKSFRDAARQVLSPMPATPKPRRRRGGGGGMISFMPAARAILFRPAQLPGAAYAPAIAFLSDTLHWLELWNDAAVDASQNDAEYRPQNPLFPSL